MVAPPGLRRSHTPLPVRVPTSMTSGIRLATHLRTRRTCTSPHCLRRDVLVDRGLTAALVFAASLRHLVQEPRLFGYAWDAAVIAEPENLDA